MNGVTFGVRIVTISSMHFAAFELLGILPAHVVVGAKDRGDFDERLTCRPSAVKAMLGTYGYANNVWTASQTGQKSEIRSILIELIWALQSTSTSVHLIAMCVRWHDVSQSFNTTGI